MTRKVLENVFPTCSAPSTISRDLSTQFSEQITRAWMANLANFTELSLSPPCPSATRQGQENELDYSGVSE